MTLKDDFRGDFRCREFEGNTPIYMFRTEDAGLCEVVLARRGQLGFWEGLGKGLGQGRSVYKQPKTEVDGSCHS